MTNEVINTEDKIFIAAYRIFLLFGYHGTTIQQIAMQAGVNKSAVHYYFRSKEKLYVKVVKKVLDHILNERVNSNTNQDGFEKQIWFLITEIYNNKILFERTLKEIYPDDWDEKLGCLMQWFELKSVPFCTRRNKFFYRY